MTPASLGEGRLAASDHTAVVAFCLKHAAQLAVGPQEPADVLRRAADLMGGRGGDILTSARHAGISERPEQTLEGLRIGLRTAEDLLESGAPTIYRPGYWEEEGMLILSGPVGEGDASSALRVAIAELAHAGASAAFETGSRCGGLPPANVVQEALRAAIAASVPIAVRLAEDLATSARPDGLES